jgi:hypothetical protein
MRRYFSIGFFIFVLLACSVAGLYILERDDLLTSSVLKQVNIPSASAASSEGPRHYPLPPSHSALEKLPSLQRSDALMRKELVGLFGSGALLRFFDMQDIVRHIVATIDNLPRQTVAVRLLPVKPLSSKFLTASNRSHDLFIAHANAARYTPYVHLAEMVDTKYLVSVYVRLYPLFEQAYRELGYPHGDFNDRLIAVIDHLLATPLVKTPIALVRPHRLYQFADPALEARSAGQKILLRMGSENEQRIKVKLQSIRRELTGSA